ncbi:MAG: AAA family ATPase [Pseudomonadota bacterium]
MHLKKIRLKSELFPTRERYPFNLGIFRNGLEIEFTRPVTFLMGENGTGKSTLLESLANRAGIHIWRDDSRTHYEYNPLERQLYRAVELEWADGPVPGSFFSAGIFQTFVTNLDEWAATDPGQLNYFGGKSLRTQSHGQSLMSYFRNRYKIRGLYFLDEPETALSPKSQIELLQILTETSRSGRAQFITATHSPILTACPDAAIYSFDHGRVRKTTYEDTEHFRLYKAFMTDPGQFV